MPRKPSEIVQYKLRIREALRRKVELAAKKRQVSANYEMASRLEASFTEEARRDIDEVAQDLKVSYLRHQQPFHALATHNGLRDAAEALVVQIERLPAACREHEGMQSAVEEMRKWFKVMDHEAAMAVRSVKHV